MRFDERVRGLNAVAFAVMTIFASGISMNALAKLLNQLLGWNYNFALLICSGVVLLYVLKGGLDLGHLHRSAAILHDRPRLRAGGLSRLEGRRRLARDDQLHCRALRSNPAALYLNTSTSFAPDAWTSAWKPCWPDPTHNPMGVDCVCDGLRSRLRAFASVTGAPTSWSSSAPWRPRT